MTLIKLPDWAKSVLARTKHDIYVYYACPGISARGLLVVLILGAALDVVSGPPCGLSVLDWLGIATDDQFGT